MPITIQHGGTAGTAAGQIIAQAGQANLAREQQNMMQLRQLAQQRDMQKEQIAAQSQSQMQAAEIAMQRMVLSAGLQKEMQEEEYSNRLMEIREQAEIQAGQWESEYSFKAKQRIAGIQNGVEQARASGNFSKSQMQELERMESMLIMGVPLTHMPKSKESQLMDALAKQGRSPGTPWKGDDGGTYSTEFDDAGRLKIRLLVRPDQTPEAMEAKLQREREKDLAEMRSKLEELTITDPLKKTERSKYSPEEVEGKVRRIYEWYNEEQIEREQEEAAAAANARAKREANMGLPSEVVQAQDYMREIMEEYGGGGKGIMDILLGVPEEKREAAIEAYNILMQAQN